MARNLRLLAKRSTLKEFLEEVRARGPVDWSDPLWAGTLSGAIANKSPEDRVAIANFVLDQGVDPSVVDDGDRTNILHELFVGGERGHDFELEAPLLERLLDGGADINLRSPRFGVPLEALSSMGASDEKLQPFYDVVFARPDIDMSMVINDHNSTLGDLLTSTTRPDMTRRATEYIARRGS